MHSAELLSPVVNLSVHSIYKIVENFNRIGGAALVHKPKGGRRRYLLSIEQEASLFASLEEQASKGRIKTANNIRSIVENKVGKEVPDDYLWDLLKRNGWKKKLPRPHQPKRRLRSRKPLKKLPEKLESTALAFPAAQHVYRLLSFLRMKPGLEESAGKWLAG